MAIATITATNPETGYIYKEDNVWATAWGAAVGTPLEGIQAYEAYCRIVSSEYRLSRGRIRFDTSALSGVIVSAKLRIAFNRIVHNNGDNYLHFVRAVGCGDDMATADFGSLKDNTEDICDPIQVSSIVADTYIEREFNNLGREMINTVGYTIIGLRLDDDINNIAPVDGVKEVWITWYGGVYAAAPTGYEAKLVVGDTSVVTEFAGDWVTGIVHRVGPGHYSNELILGGLDTRWHYVDYTPEPIPAVPSEVEEKGKWLGPFWERTITEEGMKFRMYWLSPEGVRSYIDLPESFAPPG